VSVSSDCPHVICCKTCPRTPTLAACSTTSDEPRREGTKRSPCAIKRSNSREIKPMQLDLVDVFGSEALKGNPLGVVRDCEQMDAAAMLRLTQWLGFSETTFLLPPTDPAADYRVRIFYPAGELPFAGHPTLG